MYYWLRSFHKLTERMAQSLALLGLSGLLVLALLVVADITLRWVANFPLQGVNDVYAVVMAVVIASCIPNSVLTKQNISIEMLGEALGGRARLALNCFASAVALLFFILFAWQFVPYSSSITASGQKTWVLKWPVGPWWWVGTALFCFAMVVQLLVFLSDLSKVLWPERLAFNEVEPLISTHVSEKGV